MAPSSSKKYKIKLTSGRVLGPIGLDRIQLFIVKGLITGVELAREHPVGEWVDINTILPIADLLVAHARGALSAEPTTNRSSSHFSAAGTTRVLDDPGPTIPLPSLKLDRPANAAQKKTVPKQEKPPSESPEDPALGDDEKTVVALQPGHESVEDSEQDGFSDGMDDSERTMINQNPLVAREPSSPAKVTSGSRSLALDYDEGIDRGIAEQRTVMMENPLLKESWGFQDAIKDPRKLSGAVNNSVRDLKKKIIGGLATLSVIFAVYTMMDFGGGKGPRNVAWVPIRPAIPKFDSSIKDPSRSVKFYDEAMKYYLLDNVVGYKRAAHLLTLAVQYDNSNVKALAMLASTYLNLIDSSNKDENYFAVISKLIELSRASHLDLPETVIADVEFYITVNKAEAAENRIVDYTKSQVTFGVEMFYYLALAFYHRGDAHSAVRYISQYPENRAFSPKLFYLRGRIAEKLGDKTAAIQEYEKAIKMSPFHAKSRLAIARIRNEMGDLQDAAAQLEYLSRNPGLLAPKDLAEAYFLHAKLSEFYHKDEIALQDLTRAVRLEPGNHDYLLEYYSLQAKLGENVAATRSRARMYYFLGEGEKYLKKDKYHDALTQFLRALESDGKSPLPYVKIGDMYMRMHDLTHAMDSYEKAAKLAPNSIAVWSKYIHTLIQSYDWKKALAAMQRFRHLNVPQSAIDKAAADLYARQGNYEQARIYYQKAMSRDSIDSTVYIAYAKTLMNLKNYKEAPFFFALARRFDPLNVEALVGTAKCIAATESIDRAISYLQDELQKGTVAKAELLAAIAELYIQKGSWDQAKQYVDQSMAANPDYAYPFKLLAEIYMNRLDEKGMLDKALDAYNSYSERNSSDPSGYLERYRIFIKKGEFEKADEELMKIYAIYPKYPNLHFYKGALYSIMGNNKRAMEEYKIELENNPDSVGTLIALGKELVKAGAPVQAITEFNKAMQLAPRSSEAKAEAGYASYLLKNYAGAIALYDAAIQFDPGNALIYRRLAITYRDMGDHANAVRAFNKYLELDPDEANKVSLSTMR